MPPASDQDERPQSHSAASEKHTSLSAMSLDFVLTADWVAPSLSRNRVQRWLIAHQWSPAHTDDLVLAVSEAVSNSVEHGYGITTPGSHPPTMPDHPGTVEVHGQVRTDPDGTRRVEFTIVDHGSWVEPTTGRSNRRQGIRIMRACTEETVIEHDDDGTTIVLRSWPIPRSPDNRPRFDPEK